MKIINEKTIEADEGMMLTDGTAFGVIVYLGINDSEDNWHEITEEEAERLKSEETKPTEDEATESDYILALKTIKAYEVNNQKEIPLSETY